MVYIAEPNTLRPSVLRDPNRNPDPFIMSCGVMTGGYMVTSGRTPGIQSLCPKCGDQAFSSHLLLGLGIRLEVRLAQVTPWQNL